VASLPIDQFLGGDCESFEYGMKEVIRTQPDVYTPSGPGLGLEIDWDAMASVTAHILDSAA
jgi:hypothetical protein